MAGGSLLLVPMACSFLGIGNDVAMQAVAIGFIIGVVQDSVETALNSSGDVFFTATADIYDKKKTLQKEKQGDPDAGNGGSDDASEGDGLPEQPA